MSGDLFGYVEPPVSVKKFQDWHAAIAAICREFQAERGRKFEPSRRFFRDLRTAEELSEGNIDEVVRRWRIALRSTHPVIGELSGLVARWNQFATSGPGKEKAPGYDANQGILRRPSGTLDSCAVCGGVSSGVVWGHPMCALHYADWLDSGAGEADTAKWIAANKGELSNG